jgi:uncharacterized protein (TIGR02453 family)
LKNDIPVFSGFSKNSFKFLSDLVKNNNTVWFNKNRDRYRDDLVQPARAFVIEMHDFFNRLNPSIRTEPKFNETLMRINKDMRFSKGEPYRNYFLIHFGRFKMDTEFYVYLDPDSFDYGLFLNNTDDGKNFYFNENITRYKKEFLAVLENYHINNKYQLYELAKESQLIEKNFSANKHLEKLSKLKMALFQKSLPLNNKKIFSPDFVFEAVKTFSQLYPIFCFSVSPRPLKMIEDFEEHFGSAVL